jgi:hypothetical protein
MTTEELTKIKEDPEKVLANLSNSETALQNIKNKESEADGVVISIKNKEAALQGKIEENERSMQTKLTEAEEILSKIKITDTNSGTLKTQAQSKVDEIEALRVKADELDKKIQDPTTGVETILKKIDVDNETSTKKIEEATKHLEDIEKLRITIEGVEQVAKTKSEEIESLRQGITKTYSWITGEGLHHSFSKRKDDLENSMIFWRRMTIGSVVFLSLILAGIYCTSLEQFSTLGWERFLYKITFSSPALIILSFSALQFSRAQKLMESYAFKAATAQALENYTEVLEKRFSDDKYKGRILNFVINSMQSIYRHPSKDDSLPEEKAVEENSLENLTNVLKTTEDKVVDPISNAVEKIS